MILALIGKFSLKVKTRPTRRVLWLTVRLDGKDAKNVLAEQHED